MPVKGVNRKEAVSFILPQMEAVIMDDQIVLLLRELSI